MSTRRGSIIIYCLALAALLVIVGYGFLRSTRADIQAHGAINRHQLAQSTARMGVTQALEGILRDHADPAAITILDGRYRAPFVSFHRPNEIEGVDYNHPQTDDDASGEHQVTMPLLEWAGGSEGVNRFGWHSRDGAMVYDGRGRYVEPEFGDPLAMEGIRFTDSAPALPARRQPLLLDHALTRIDTGNLLDDRTLARYRLRYVIGVEDLAGHLLTNPMAEDRGAWWETDPDRQPLLRHYPDWLVGGQVWHDGTKPAAINPAQWLDGSHQAWYNIARSLGGPQSIGLRAQHTFLGRGNATNIARDAAGSPVTFPMMFRGLNSGASGFWGVYRIENNSEAQDLYNSGSPAGGQPIARTSASNAPYLATGYGPQLSWFNQIFAMRGWTAQWIHDDGYSPFPNWPTAMLTMTPYGQRLVRSDRPAAEWQWYEGRVDTPWYVNLMTAAPRTIHAMLSGYIPPRSRLLTVHTERFERWNPVAKIYDPPIDRPVNIDWSHGYHDLFTRLSSPAFDAYLPPLDGTTPNFLKPDTRPNEARYPGALWWQNDNLGKDIDVNTRHIGTCTHTGRPFFLVSSATRQVTRANSELPGGELPVSPPPDWNVDVPTLRQPQDRFTKIAYFTHAPSYYADLCTAFTQAIAIARATRVQYATRTFDPANITMLPAECATLEGIDRIFLRQLDENYDDPGGAAIASVNVHVGYGGRNNTFTGSVSVSHTIRSLVDASLVTPAQANVMERVLNDFRMSFLGASPQYSEQFRPLDFSGDGFVHASCYNPVGPDLDLEQGIAWKRPVEAVGRGPMPDHWFSMTGCFFIGKSRHFRIFSRGEVWDTLIQKTVAEAQLETVAVVDPESSAASDVRILFQRWHYDRYTGHLPRQTD